MAGPVGEGKWQLPSCTDVYSPLGAGCKFFEALFSRVFSRYGQTHPAVAKRMRGSVFTLDSHRGTSVPLFGMLGMPNFNYIVASFCFIVHMEMSKV